MDYLSRAAVERAKSALDIALGGPSPAASKLGLSARDVAQYRVTNVLNALRGFEDNAGLEMECSREIAKKLLRDPACAGVFVPAEVLTRSMPLDVMVRALASTPGSKGGYLIGVENLGFIDILRARSVVLSMGARSLSGLKDNIAGARQTGKVTVSWQQIDGTSVSASDQALGQVSMTPKTCVAITDVSEQLLLQNSPSAEAFVMADLAAAVAIDGLDAAAINGTGGAQPLGIKNTPGVTTGQDASSATYAKILDFVGVAGTANAVRGNPGFVTNIAGAIALMKVQRFTGSDSPIWTGNAVDGELVGFAARSSQQLASGNLIFGSWDELVVGDWGVLELAMDRSGTRFNQLQVGIRALWMVDVLLRYPQAFVVSTNLS